MLEPIVCNLGVVIPEKEFFESVFRSCKKYGTLLIIDEVATGFGRTGKLFASEWYDLEPDIMCFGKALTGGYGAMGATIMTPEVAKSMEYDFSFYSTFGWHPLNVAASLANIKYLLKEKCWEKNIEVAEYFESRLEEIKFKYSAEIRAIGMTFGVEFKEDNYANDIVKQCLKNGLIFSDLGNNIFTLFPALNIDMATAKRGMDILEKSVLDLN